MYYVLFLVRLFIEWEVLKNTIWIGYSESAFFFFNGISNKPYKLQKHLDGVVRGDLRSNKEDIQTAVLAVDYVMKESKNSETYQIWTCLGPVKIL